MPIVHLGRARTEFILPTARRDTKPQIMFLTGVGWQCPKYPASAPKNQGSVVGTLSRCPGHFEKGGFAEASGIRVKRDVCFGKWEAARSTKGTNSTSTIHQLSACSRRVTMVPQEKLRLTDPFVRILSTNTPSPTAAEPACQDPLHTHTHLESCSQELLSVRSSP